MQPQQTIPQKFQKEFEQQYERLLKETMFTPLPAFGAIWKKYALRAMRFLSPRAENFKAGEYHQIYEAIRGKRKMSLFAFGIICNNLEARSAKDLRINLAKHAQVMQLVSSYSEQWGLQHAPIRDRASTIAKEIIEAQTIQENKNSNAQQNGREIKMPIKKQQ